MTKPEQRSLRYWLHKPFAYPFYLIWILGALCVWVPLTLQFREAGVFGSALLAQRSTVPFLILFYAATSGLGFFAALFTVGWLIVAICRRLNGAPFEVGKSVIILSGTHAGQVCNIYEIAKGQGGQPLLRLDLGPVAKGKLQDLYEEYQVLRVS